jgi:hypothetical protein
MDVGAYLALGLDGLTIVALIVTMLWARSLSDRANGATDQLLVYAKDEITKTLDAERARFDLAAMTAARDAQRVRAGALERFVAATAKETDDAKPLAPDDLAGHVLRVSRAGAAGLPAAGTNDGAGAAGPVRPS